MKVIRRQSDQDRHERMPVEFVGGPFDGQRLWVHVVQDGPTRIRVLEAPYDAPRETATA